MAYSPATLIEVRAWNRTVGALVASPRSRAYAFEYDPSWRRTAIELSPALMPVNGPTRVYTFPGLSEKTFQYLPPMIADALPDRFGNAVVDAYLAREGVARNQITPLDRLAYLGSRGLGALEFRPDVAPHSPAPTGLDLADLITSARAAIEGSLASEAESEASLRRIIDVGTSAGGARAKAIVNLNIDTMELRSGHLPPEPGFEPWLLKFDGVGSDEQVHETGNFGRVEYAYSRMARDAGIQISETRLLEENGRAHFMTRRFDREPGKPKLHLQTLCGMDALDFNQTGTHDYAQYLSRIDSLGLDEDALVEGFRRAAFNVAAANCDDHTKNFSFLLDAETGWRLAPAYDITHAYRRESLWVSQHQMSVNGEFADIRRSHLLALADRFAIPGAKTVLARVADSVARWSAFASDAGVPRAMSEAIAADHRVAEISR
jgi:serine/threonine-protein kinase HipA